MRNPFRKTQRYVTGEDARGVVWRKTQYRDDAGLWSDDPTSSPVKVFDPNYVPTWESVEDDGSVTVHTGPYPTPKALDYVIYGSVATVVLLVGVLIGAAA